MRLIIEISLDNAAFEDGGTDEAKRCVAAALERLRGCWGQSDAVVSVFDVNGNKVGKALVTD
jgi:hypothetical protein